MELRLQGRGLHASREGSSVRWQREVGHGSGWFRLPQGGSPLYIPIVAFALGLLVSFIQVR